MKLTIKFFLIINMNIEIQEKEIKIYMHYYIWIIIFYFWISMLVFVIEKIIFIVSLQHPTNYSFKTFMLIFDFKVLMVFFHYGKLIKLNTK